MDAGRSPAETISIRTGKPYPELNARARHLANAIAKDLLDAAMRRSTQREGG